MIHVLDKLTIDQIAAGEVVERPLSIVKELVENAIDAGSDAITVEIKGGGIDQIRITDNGCGIEKNELPTAFLRHATSKINDANDLLSLTSLGFRGEALSSIAAISKIELITRTHDSIVGTRYLIEGGEQIKIEEIGSPEGTTFIVRDVFYNTPARREFLKSKTTEANAIAECMLTFSLSHPEIRFQFINDGKPKLKTSGDNSLRTNIFYNFGSDLTKVLIPIDAKEGDLSLSGFIAKPEFSRGNRSYMHYFVNGRYIKNNTIHAAIMDGYRDYLMNHRFPFVTLMLEISPDMIDVNIHPTKKEIRFRDERAVYELFYHEIKASLDRITLIPEEKLGDGEEDENTVAKDIKKDPEPFEKSRLFNETITSDLNTDTASDTNEDISDDINSELNTFEAKSEPDIISNTDNTASNNNYRYEQQRFDKPLTVEESGPFLNSNLFREEDAPAFRIIGQIFDTYWLIEYKDELLIIDQHAAHEKVLYERVVKKMKEKKALSQALLSPIVVSLSGKEQTALAENAEAFKSFGFEWEEFGDREFLIKAVPADFLNLDAKEIFIDILDSIMDGMKGKKPEMILDRLATISCKAAVKGNNTLSIPEVKTLISEMLSLDEPYHCPHGRPTTISLSKYEFEKRFKRLV